MGIGQRRKIGLGDYFSEGEKWLRDIGRDRGKEGIIFGVREKSRTGDTLVLKGFSRKMAA